MENCYQHAEHYRAFAITGPVSFDPMQKLRPAEFSEGGRPPD